MSSYELTAIRYVRLGDISVPVAWFDRHIVDGTMNGIAMVTESTAKLIKGFQSGRMQQYALAIVYGVVILAIVFVYIWK